MKKIALFSLILISEAALAVGEYQPPKAMHYLTGFYAKLGLGGTIAQFDLDQTLKYYPFVGFNNDFIDSSVEHQAQGTQVAGNLGIGYTYQLDALWVIGAEFTAGITSANTSFRSNSNTGNVYLLNGFAQATLNNDFALVVKPGLAIQQRTQFYALLGVRWGNFETQLNTDFIHTPTTIDVNSQTEYHQYILGFTVGLGVERLLTDHWGLGLEYAYTSYGNLASLNNDTLLPPTLFTGIDSYLNNSLTGSAASSTLLLESSYRF